MIGINSKESMGITKGGESIHHAQRHLKTHSIGIAFPEQPRTKVVAEELKL
jgi:hypothetical protein